MIGEVKKFFNEHLDFGIYSTTIISILTALAVLPCMYFLPEKCGFENGLLENLQMAVLFIGCFFACRSKIDKKFFNFVLLVLFILIIREVNCGRTLFFAVPGVENAYYSWKEIKYGWLAHPIYGLYMAYVGFYFLKNKLFVDLWQKIKNIKMPLWDVILMITGMVLGTYAEEVSHNFLMEESTELLFYVALVGIIYLYTRDKRFREE